MGKTKITHREKYTGMVMKCNIQSSVEVQMRLTPPRYLMPSYWKQHNLSKEDVETIMGFTPTRDVLLLAIAIGATELAPSIFKMGYASLSDINIGSKSSTIRKIILKLETSFLDKTTSVLDTSPMSMNHTPPLTKHYISKQDADRLRAAMLPCDDTLEATSVTDLYRYMDQDWMPIQIEGDAIFALRAVKQDLFDKTRRDNRKSVSSRTPMIEFKGEQFAIPCDDGILFSAGLDGLE